MKSLQDLKKHRDLMDAKRLLKNKKDGLRVTVGLATCGVTAGSKPIYNYLEEEVKNRNLKNIEVTQVGCIGECALEPIVEVFDAKGVRTTYVNVNLEVAKNILEMHLINHCLVKENLIDNFR